MIRSNPLSVACLGLAALAALAIPAGSMSARADGDPRETAPGHTLYGDPSAPDISGLWLGSFLVSPGFPPQQPPAEPDTVSRWMPSPAPLTPAYKKIADDRRAAAKAGRAVGDLGSRCLPFGMPFVISSQPFQNEIVQTPGEVSLWMFGTFPIVIWTDGRPHPKDQVPSYNGHSIGHWVDDTLYVDTVGVLAPTAIDSGPGTPHSDKLHIKWTIQRVGDNTLHTHITLYDTDAFREPMTTTNISRRKSGQLWQVVDDVSCFENNRETLDGGGAPGFKTF